MLSLTLLAISFTTVTIASPAIVEDIKNREYRIEDVFDSLLPETDDLGRPKEVGQVIDIYAYNLVLTFSYQIISPPGINPFPLWTL